MKQKILLLLSLLCFSTCQKIAEEDLNGNWIAFPSGYDEPFIWEINFADERVEWIDGYQFKESGAYKVENDEVIISLNRDGLILKTRVEKLIADTFVIFDRLTYYRDREITNSIFEEYELVDISTCNFLSNEKNYFQIIHFYKSDNGVTQIRAGDKMTNYADVSLFLVEGHSLPEILIFLGKGINLEDLKNLYYRLASNGQFSLMLVTKKEGISDYHIFKDKIEIWWDDLENYSANFKLPQPPLPPPPPIEFTSKKSYLKDGGVEIKILNENDLYKIDNLNNQGKYVISIGKNISIKNYIQLKTKLSEKRRANPLILTEIE